MEQVKTHVPQSAPDKHYVPRHIMVLITLAIPMLVAMTNWVMIEVDVRLVSLKFDSFEGVLQEQGWVLGTLVLMAFAVLYSGIAACVVFFFSPICAGSGLPEAKGYLNGNRIPGMFMKRNFIIRTAGIVLATASGFPVGREGPMVCIGGCIGIAVVDLLAQPYVRDWVSLDSGSDMAALVVHEARFAAAKRVGCVLGAAAGIAVAFNAPVGAILYMFEEVTVAGWPSELTFRAFVVTALASFASRLLLNIMGSDVHRLLIYEEAHHGARDWDWLDMPFFVILAAICGLTSGLFSKVLADVWTKRRNFVVRLGKRSYLKVAEVMLYAAFVALVFCVVPAFVECTPNAVHGGDHGGAVVGHETAAAGAHASLAAASHASAVGGAFEPVVHGAAEEEHGGHGRRLSSLTFARYTCPEGQHNEVATLVLSTAEGAVKHLFSRNSEDLALGSLLIAWLFYLLLACGMPGLSVPMGMFVPNLLLGAMMGRFVGQAVNLRIDHSGLAHPGVYAMVGSAAMLSGFTHMTIAIVVLLLEAAQDLSTVSPLMLGVFVAHFCSKLVSHEGYDELLIVRKGVPFLGADTVEEMEHTEIMAGQLCRKMPAPEGSVLSPDATIEDVRRALQVEHMYEYPVVDEDGMLMGLVSRSCLEAAMEAIVGLRSEAPAAPLQVGSLCSGGQAPDSPGSGRLTVSSLKDRTFKVTFMEERLSKHEGYSDMASVKDMRAELSKETRNVARQRIMTEVTEARERIRTEAAVDLEALVEMQRVDTKVSNLPSNESLSQMSTPHAETWPTIPLHRIMDPAPHVLLEDMPMTRFYTLFTTSSTNAACVISADGTFQGVLSRSHLIAAVKEHAHGHHHGETHHAAPHLPEVPKLPRDGSRVSLTQPKTHGLPALTIWGITFLIALLVALTNIGMVVLDLRIVTWKYNTMQDLLVKDGFFAGLLVFVLTCSGLALVAAMLVCYCAPICAGSGIPEAKGYINGNYVRGMFEPQNFLVRALGVVMSTAAGFPVGREGPMVCIGGIVGVAVVHVLASPHVRMAVALNRDGGSQALVLMEDRFRHAKRIGCVLGAAAGIATAFAAPVGAILYMIEEVTVDTWPHELTLRTFVCTAVAVMLSRVILNLSGQDVHRLLIYQQGATETKTWNWVDVPFFVFVAALGGLAAAVMTRIFVQTWTRRQKRFRLWQERGWQPYGKILECCAFAALCAFIFMCVPAVTGCSPVPHDNLHDLVESAHHDAAGTVHGTAASSHGSAVPGATQLDEGAHHRRLSGGGHGLNLVRYTCPEGQYSQVASLLLSGAEGAVKHLFARNGAETLEAGSLFLVFLSYVPLACGMPGMPVPMGAFVPSMLTGALIGRIVGEALSGISGIAHAGIYSMVCSAAVLGGFTHMSLAIVVLLIEASHDLSLVSPLMLSVFIARSIAKWVNHHGYDEILILKKGVAFLDSKCPHELRDLRVTDVCSLVPRAARLKPWSSEKSVRRALGEEVVHYPVFELDVCVGTVSRARLQEVLKEREKLQGERPKKNVMERVATLRKRADDDEEPCAFAGDHGGATPGVRVTRIVTETSDDAIPIRELMDPAPYMLLEETMVLRAYPLFTKAGLTTACVVTRRGDFVGLLSRANLLSNTGRAHGVDHSPRVRADSAKSASGGLGSEASASESETDSEDDDYDDEESVDAGDIEVQVPGVGRKASAASSSAPPSVVGRPSAAKFVRFGPSGSERSRQSGGSQPRGRRADSALTVESRRSGGSVESRHSRRSGGSAESRHSRRSGGSAESRHSRRSGGSSGSRRERAASEGSPSAAAGAAGVQARRIAKPIFCTGCFPSFGTSMPMNE